MISSVGVIKTYVEWWDHSAHDGYCYEDDGTDGSVVTSMGGAREKRRYWYIVR